ncbi:MAG: Dabb family protein [Chitinophagales bacterium]
MKQLILTFVIFTSFFISCQQAPNPSIQVDLDKLRAELQQKDAQLTALQQKLKEVEPTEENLLVHLVFFKVKDDISAKDKTKLMQTLEGLAVIEEVKNLEVGNFEDLGDKRALSDYDVVMQMEFSSAADYKEYQEDERHLKAKGVLKSFLAGPPASYDFVVE